MKKHRQTTKPGREGRDVLARTIAVLSLGLAAYQFYFTQLRVADDARASVLSMVTDADTNGYPVVRMDMLFRNEGTRPITIRHVSLVLSETPSFTLPVLYPWDNGDPLVIYARNCLNTRIAFGLGMTKNPMIIARGFNEPLIYGRLAVDVIDAHGRLHRIQREVCTLQFTPLLHIEWTHMPPWDIVLLPTDAQPPYVSLEADSKHIGVELKVVDGIAQQVTNDGPLSWRLQGVYTNDPPGCWPVKPITNAAVYRRVE